jgi:hypothetical protein
MELGLTETVREELHHAKTQLETGKLLQRLSKTHRVNRYSQVALTASLLLAVGLWFGGAGSNAKAEKTANTSNIVVAQLAPAQKVNEPVELDNLKLSADLGTSSPLQGTQGQVEKEF